MEMFSASCHQAYKPVCFCLLAFPCPSGPDAKGPVCSLPQGRTGTHTPGLCSCRSLCLEDSSLTRPPQRLLPFLNLAFTYPSEPN